MFSVCMIICALQEIGFQFPREAGVRLRDRPAKVEIDWSLHEELKGYDKEYWSLMVPSMAAERVANVGDGAHLIYTDGSKGGNGVGAAYWDSTFDFSEEKSLRPENSIFTAELVAIRMALQRSRTTVANGRNVCVMSDSLSSLQALQSSIKEVEVPTLIADIFTEIDLLYQTGRSVRLMWVPSHVGIVGNERADRCARHAAEGLPDNNEVLRIEDWYAQCMQGKTLVPGVLFV
ncbi:uncharacterized protein DMENIID0001_132770 [Sergentomyia squamirostris]